MIGSRALHVSTCPLAELFLATHSSITFDDQKNRERGEVIGHGRSGHSVACPTLALARHIAYIRGYSKPASTPLCMAKGTGTRWVHVTSTMITTMLRCSAAALPDLGFSPNDVNARSLRAGGAMALLCGKVDMDIICLVGRWKSKAMFRYLHAQALPLMANLASTILNYGTFTLLPSADMPPAANALLAQVNPT